MQPGAALQLKCAAIMTLELLICRPFWQIYGRIDILTTDLHWLFTAEI
jgi:hypothetical protein